MSSRNILGESTGEYLNRADSGSFSGKAGRNASLKETSGSAKGKKLSAKQKLVAEQKAEAARKIREEKARLREEKQRRKEEFLKKSAEKREQVEQLSEARKLAIQYQTNAEIASKELENSDRRWMLEQERLHRLDLEAERKLAKAREMEKKAKERENILAAQRKEEERKQAERRAEQLRQAEELENQRMIKELERMEREREQQRETEERLERKRKDDEAHQKALEEAQASRALDEAAYQDAQEYIQQEKRKRRESIAMRLQEESQWKKQQNQQKMLDDILAAKDRELEMAAYNDMKRYLQTEKNNRRQSLAQFLQQESEYRKLQELEKDHERQRELESRALDDAARRDAQAYLQSEKEKRRQSLAMRLHHSSQADIDAAMRNAEEKMVEEKNRKLEDLAYEDTLRYKESVREQEIAKSFEQTRKEVEAAKKAGQKLEAELLRLEQKKQQDLEDYARTVSEKFFLTTQDQAEMERIEEEDDVNQSIAQDEDVLVVEEEKTEEEKEEEEKDECLQEENQEQQNSEQEPNSNVAEAQAREETEALTQESAFVPETPMQRKRVPARAQGCCVIC